MFGKKKETPMKDCVTGLTLRDVFPELAGAEARAASVAKELLVAQGKVARFEGELEALRASCVAAEAQASLDASEDAVLEIQRKNEQRTEALEAELYAARTAVRKLEALRPILSERVDAAHERAVAAFRAEVRRRHAPVAKRILDLCGELIDLVEQDEKIRTACDLAIANPATCGSTWLGGSGNLIPFLDDVSLVTACRNEEPSYARKMLEKARDELEGVLV